MVCSINVETSDLFSKEKHVSYELYKQILDWSNVNEQIAAIMHHAYAKDEQLGMQCMWLQHMLDKLWAGEV